MKRNVHTTHLVSLAIAITAALSQPVFAQVAPHSLIVTENSSTNLTATYDGSISRVTVIPGLNPADDWKVIVSSATFSLSSLGASWMEPSGSDFNTIVAVSLNTTLPPSSIFEFFSDTSMTSGGAFANGGTFMNVGTDAGDGGQINLTFIDKGDVASAPDTGSTLGMLALALAALFGASRLRSIRLA